MGISKKLVTIYVRKSRLKGDDELEITRQIELLTDYADANNMDYKEFYEEGSSEDWEGRPELQKMLKELETGIYDGVLVTEQDRMSRDATDMGLFKRFCRKEEILFYTLNKTYNFMNDDDNFMTGIQAEMDAHFMRITKRKLLRGRVQALKSGVSFGYAPFGYNKSPVKPKILIKDPNESKAVEMIFNMYVNEKAVQREIAEKVNLLGYKTRENKPFTDISISLILKNVVHKGTLSYELKGLAPIIVENAHEAIISEKLFEDAQIIRSQRRKAPPGAKDGKYLLSQLVKCAKCKTNLSFAYKRAWREKKTEMELHMMNCYASLSSKRKKEIKGKCDNIGVKASRIEEAVLQDLQGYLVNLENEIELLTQDGDSGFKDVRDKIEQIDKRLDKLDFQKSRIQEGYENGIYDADEAKNKLRRIKEDGIILKRSREEAENMDSSSEIEKRKTARERIMTVLSNEGNDIVETNRTLREVIDCIHYYKAGKDSYTQYPFKIEIVYK